MYRLCRDAGVAAVAAAVGFVSGCAGRQAQPPGPPPSPIMTAADFDDVPVPLRFTQARERSWVIRNAAFRCGSLVYRGALRAESVRDWYKQVMPAHGWASAAAPAAETGTGPYTLRFEKGVERCDVRIDAPAAVTTVTITLDLK